MLSVPWVKSRIRFLIVLRFERKQQRILRKWNLHLTKVFLSQNKNQFLKWLNVIQNISMSSKIQVWPKMTKEGGREFCKSSNHKMRSFKNKNKRQKKLSIQRNNLNTNQNEIYKTGQRHLNIKSNNPNFECRQQSMVIQLSLLFQIIILSFTYLEKNLLLKRIQSNRS